MITDEMVEKAARAYFVSFHLNPDLLSEETAAPFKECIRAALEAVLPAVVEECRQAVIAQVRLDPAQQLWSAGYDTAIEDASNALLSLLGKGE